jgi:hypothetical protein
VEGVAAVENNPGAGLPTSEVTVRFRPTVSDYISASLRMSRSSVATVTLGAWSVAIGVIPALDGELFGFFSVALGLLFLTGVYCLPFIWYAVRRRPDLMLGEYEFHADSVGIRVTMPTTRTEQTWATFKRVRELPDVFLLDYGTGASGVIPRRAFDPPALAAFRNLAKAAGKLEGPPGWDRTLLGLAIGVVAAVAFILVVSAIALG